MEKLSTIQKRNNLNEVYVLDEAHSTNKGHHDYAIVPKRTLRNFREHTSFNRY